MNVKYEVFTCPCSSTEQVPNLHTDNLIQTMIARTPLLPDLAIGINIS